MVISLVLLDCLPQLSVAIYVIWYTPGSSGNLFVVSLLDVLLLLPLLFSCEVPVLGILLKSFPSSEVSFPSELVLVLDEVEPLCVLPLVDSAGKSPVLI